MKREAHPMQAKKNLAARIVKDFHSADAATKAAEDWAKQFQKRETPESVQEVRVPIASVVGATSNADIQDLLGNSSCFFFPDRNAVISAPPEQPRKLIKLEKLLASAGLAESATDGLRKIKQRAVEIDGQLVTAPHLLALLPFSGVTIRAGKKMKIVSISENHNSLSS
jgi:tyrosyl-tRNA synthetase